MVKLKKKDVRSMACQYSYHINKLPVSLFYYLPVLYIPAWRDSFYLFKLLVKIRNIIKAAFVTDPGNIQLVFYQ